MLVFCVVIFKFCILTKKIKNKNSINRNVLIHYYFVFGFFSQLIINILIQKKIKYLIFLIRLRY